MRPIATILITFLLAATACAQDKSKAAAGGASAAKPKAYTGTISDSMCLNKHMWKAMGAADDADSGQGSALGRTWITSCWSARNLRTITS